MSLWHMHVCGNKEAHKHTNIVVANRSYLTEKPFSSILTSFSSMSWRLRHTVSELMVKRGSLLSFFFAAHSIRPAMSYSRQLRPGMCRSQTAGLLNFSQETLRDIVNSVMSHLVGLHIHMCLRILYLSKKKKDMLCIHPYLCQHIWLDILVPVTQQDLLFCC